MMQVANVTVESGEERCDWIQVVTDNEPCCVAVTDEAKDSEGGKDVWRDSPL